MPAPLKISIIGTGRAATQLGRRAVERGLPVGQVIGRDFGKTAALASELKAGAASFDGKIDCSPALFVVAVSDGAIAEVAERLSKTCPGAAALHLSGATERAAIGQFFGERTAVLWPVHSFSLSEKPDWRKLPMVLETGSDLQAARLFEKFAREIGPKITRADGEQRARMHLAATIANNFSNHLMSLAEGFLEKNGAAFPALRQLFLETALKLETTSPRDAQTGPANRNDQKTMARHLELLRDEPQLAEVYRLLSGSILRNRR